MSQGQTLSVAVLHLPQPVFSHGQLYVGVSRVSNPHGLKILSLDSQGNSDSVVCSTPRDQ
ncbi:TPA: hypothetical protein N0F65_005670 [Lagenidium giganteum]|uniref:Uncharacterized protein n=1 Tax=Lagenidium giganteum TaxID=4803 RepID=A0AAV2ZCR4_9STRA|nr:TPA: hypothetical protein N0F65_005670 [Lagenidium giganteum]